MSGKKRDKSHLVLFGVLSLVLFVFLSPSVGVVVGNSDNSEIRTDDFYNTYKWIFEESEKIGFFGSFDVVDHDVMGSFVSFNYQPQDGIVNNFSVNAGYWSNGYPQQFFVTSGAEPNVSSNIILFNTIDFSGMRGGPNEVSSFVTGDLFQSIGPGGSISVNDNPSSTISIQSNNNSIGLAQIEGNNDDVAANDTANQGESVTFETATNMSVAQEITSVGQALWLDGSGLRIWMLVQNGLINITNDPQEIRFDLDEGGLILFRVIPTFGSVGAANEAAILHMEENGFISCETKLFERERTPFYDPIIVGGNAPLVVEASSGMPVVISFLSSYFPNSSILVVSVDNNTIDPQGATNIIGSINR